MVYYQCEKCGYITNHKGKYERHLKRKNPCISQDTVCITKIENPHKPSFFPQKPSFFPHKPSQILIPTMTAYTVGKHLNVKTI